jgi:hypothetical protein
MKRLFTRATLAALAFSFVFVSFARAEDKKAEGSWTGFVTETHCGAAGAKAEHADCAVKCVKDKGAKWALYNESDKSVWVLSDQDGAAKMAGKMVTVKGTADPATKSIKVASMEEAKK